MEDINIKKAPVSWTVSGKRYCGHFISLLLGLLTYYGASEIISAWNIRYDGWLSIIALILAWYVVYATWGKHRKNLEALNVLNKR